MGLRAHRNQNKTHRLFCGPDKRIMRETGLGTAVPEKRKVRAQVKELLEQKISQSQKNFPGKPVVAVIEGKANELFDSKDPQGGRKRGV